MPQAAGSQLAAPSSQSTEKPNPSSSELIERGAGNPLAAWLAACYWSDYLRGVSGRWLAGCPRAATTSPKSLGPGAKPFPILS